MTFFQLTQTLPKIDQNEHFGGGVFFGLNGPVDGPHNTEYKDGDQKVKYIFERLG